MPINKMIFHRSLEILIYIMGQCIMLFSDKDKVVLSQALSDLEYLSNKLNETQENHHKQMELI